MRHTRWLLTIANCAVGGFISALAIVNLSMLTSVLFGDKTFGIHPHLGIADEEGALWIAAFYGIPIGLIAFSTSSWLLRRKADLNHHLAYLYVGTIIGGYLATVVWDYVLGLIGV